MGIINGSGKALGGAMPAFEGHLSQAQQKSVIAALQHYWATDVYAQWQLINRR